jgi:hypothetical protein
MEADFELASVLAIRERAAERGAIHFVDEIGQRSRDGL